MTAIETSDKFRSFCEELGEFKQKFFSHTLKSLIVFKVELGRRLIASEFYGRYGAEFFPRVSVETGISQTSLKDAAEIVEKEKITTNEKAKKFIASFEENYSSWNDCKIKLLGRGKSESATSGECSHLWVCSKCGIKK